MSSEPNPVPDARLRWLVGGLVVLLVPLVLIWWPGCRQHPPVTSREALHVLQLLNTACNTKDPNRLHEAERRIQELDQHGKLSGAEKQSFTTILDLAKAGQWSEAEAVAFRMAQDQVGVGFPAPDEEPLAQPKTSRPNSRK